MHLLSGQIVPSIVDLAEQEKVDLVAMASHGRSGLARFYYGSVAAGVLHRIERPLLIVRSASSEQVKRVESNAEKSA
jgi:nucleotide-binding universal stress UspA family protein